MRVTTDITLDFGKKSNGVTVYAKQGDANSRFIKVIPLYNGQKWNIPEGTQAFFAARKPDGKHIYNEQTVEDNSILVELTDQTLVVSGRSLCSIVLTSDTGSILTTQNFNLEVEESPGAYAELESADEVQTLQKLIDYIEDLLENGGLGGGAPLSDSVPLMNGEASAGVSKEASRADHVHPRDTGLMPAMNQMNGKMTPEGTDRFPYYDNVGKTMVYTTFARLLGALKKSIDTVKNAETAEIASKANALIDASGVYTAALPEGMTADGIIALQSDIVKALVGLATEEYVKGYAQEKGEYQPAGEYLVPTDLSEHNTSEDSHNDIRLLIDGLTARLNALADSDDDTLDQLSEVVEYIKANRGLIEGVTISKVSVSDIINNLATNVADKPLSAAQGVALKALIDALSATVSSKVDSSIVQSAINGSLASYKTSAQTEVYVQNYAQPKGNYVASDKTITITGVDENGVPHTWTVYGVVSE